MKKFILKSMVLVILVVQSSSLLASDISKIQTVKTSTAQTIGNQAKLVNVKNIKLPSTPQVINEKKSIHTKMALS